MSQVYFILGDMIPIQRNIPPVSALHDLNMPFDNGLWRVTNPWDH